MGREVRMVPATWVHPLYSEEEIRIIGEHCRGQYKPLHDGAGFAEELANWCRAEAAWNLGFMEDWHVNRPSGWIPRDRSALDHETYVDWAGDPPDIADYMPQWPDALRTHFMMYEDTSEGTPISPAFATAEELAHWLAGTGASAFGDMTATYNEWLSTIKRGSAVSGMFSPETGFVSGVAGEHGLDKPPVIPTPVKPTELGHLVDDEGSWLASFRTNEAAAEAARCINALSGKENTKC